MDTKVSLVAGGDAMLTDWPALCSKFYLTLPAVPLDNEHCSALFPILSSARLHPDSSLQRQSDRHTNNMGLINITHLGNTTVMLDHTEAQNKVI